MARKKAPWVPPPVPPETRGRAAIATVPVAVAPARRQPAILKKPAKLSARMAEVAGGTAAGCAAVCCCCPCGLVNLLVFAMVRLPAGLCQRALKARAKQRTVIKSRKAGLLGPNPAGEDGGKEEGVGLHGAVVAVAVGGEAWPAKPPPEEVMEMEKEMWAKFYSAGFWRSPSQREEEEEEEKRRDRNGHGIGDGVSPSLSLFPRSDSPR